MPVKLNLKTTMRSGYAITTNPVINPAFISVSGDSLSLSKIDTVYTLPITLKDVYQNYNESILLNNTNKENAYLLAEKLRKNIQKSSYKNITTFFMYFK